MLVLVVFVLVYPTAQSYLAQRAKLNAAERELAAAMARNAELDNQMRRWSDPAYVTSQARSRLSFVMPGERAFRVVDPETADAPDGEVQPRIIVGSDQAWYVDVWTSVQVVGESP
ncbi:MAG: septum formation initiator family protein [Micrococcales bacterium]|nr:septum formation initiator family protein [Micrococcales bacterium]